VSSHGHTDLNRQLIQDIGAGIEIIGPNEVELVPAPELLAAQCRRAAQRLGYAIPCPGLLPKGSRPTSVTDPALSKLPFADDYMRPGFRGYRQWAFLSVEFRARPAKATSSSRPPHAPSPHFASCHSGPRHTTGSPSGDRCGCEIGRRESTAFSSATAASSSVTPSSSGRRRATRMELASTTSTRTRKDSIFKSREASDSLRPTTARERTRVYR
jgi:hypothetical protein